MSVRLRIEEGIAVITLENPPVNGLSLAVRTALHRLMLEAREDVRIRAVVLHGAGKGFSAGGDIRELGTVAAASPPGLSLHVQPAIEDCGKPVIAALHGLALGGGLETALACHYRIAESDTRIALPEVRLGIMALSGTQRLPRLLGVASAAELLLSGERHVARELPALFDRLIEERVSDIAAAGVAFAREVLSAGAPLPRVRDRPIPDAAPGVILSATREKLEHSAPTLAQRGALEALAAAVESGSFDAGLARARVIYDRLVQSPEARAAREQFLAGIRTAANGTTA